MNLEMMRSTPHRDVPIRAVFVKLFKGVEGFSWKRQQADGRRQHHLMKHTLCEKGESGQASRIFEPVGEVTVQGVILKRQANTNVSGEAGFFREMDVFSASLQPGIMARGRPRETARWVTNSFARLFLPELIPVICCLAPVAWIGDSGLLVLGK